MKPLTLALIAGGAALVLLSAQRAPAEPSQRTPGLVGRIGDAVADFTWALVPSKEGVKLTVDDGYSRLVDELRRIDPRPDPVGSLDWFARGFVPEPDALSMTPGGFAGMAF